MTPFSSSPSSRLTRRTFLRASGVALALPWLDAMAAPGRAAAAADKPRRMVVVYNDMGYMPDFFFPKAAGRDYEPSDYLNLLKEHRNDLTVVSGVSHPQVDGGHAADICFLTAAPHPGRGGFRNTISLDQFAAERIGSRTRFRSLNLLIGTEQTQSLAWTASGVRIPPEYRPSVVYKQLFLQGSAQEIDAQVQKLREGRSILDAVADRARELDRQVGPDDRRRLDEYYSAVRDLEQGLVQSEEWEHKPKPKVEVPPPVDNNDANDTIGRSRLMYEMVRLAVQTASTRLITVMVNDAGSTHKLPGGEGHHNLTHHGNRPEVIAKLRQVEEGQIKVFGELLAGLKGLSEEGESLLDRTMVLHGAGMGNANAHSNDNLPILLAGGGFKHGQHLAFDRKKNLPLPNLFVSMLQRLGLEVDSFASSTGTLRGLEMV